MPGVTLKNAFFVCVCCLFVFFLEPKIFYHHNDLCVSSHLRNLFFLLLHFREGGEGEVLNERTLVGACLKFCKRDSCDSSSLLILRSPQFLSRIVLRQSVSGMSAVQRANEVNDFNYPSSAYSQPSPFTANAKKEAEPGLFVCLGLGLPAWASLMFMIS